MKIVPCTCDSPEPRKVTLRTGPENKENLAVKMSLGFPAIGMGNKYQKLYNHLHFFQK